MYLSEICTQVIGLDLYPMIHKSWQNISSPVMPEKPQWSPFKTEKKLFKIIVVLSFITVAMMV
jgi:hypothetical protein